MKLKFVLLLAGFILFLIGFPATLNYLLTGKIEFMRFDFTNLLELELGQWLRIALFFLGGLVFIHFISKSTPQERHNIIKKSDKALNVVLYSSLIVLAVIVIFLVYMMYFYGG